MSNKNLILEQIREGKSLAEITSQKPVEEIEEPFSEEKIEEDLEDKIYRTKPQKEKFSSENKFYVKPEEEPEEIIEEEPEEPEEIEKEEELEEVEISSNENGKGGIPSILFMGLLIGGIFFSQTEEFKKASKIIKEFTDKYFSSNGNGVEQPIHDKSFNSNFSSFNRRF